MNNVKIAESDPYSRRKALCYMTISGIHNRPKPHPHSGDSNPRRKNTLAELATEVSANTSNLKECMSARLSEAPRSLANTRGGSLTRTSHRAAQCRAPKARRPKRGVRRTICSGPPAWTCGLVPRRRLREPKRGARRTRRGPPASPWLRNPQTRQQQLPPQ